MNKFISYNSLPLWKFNNLTSQPGITHFVTDRYSPADASGFTLSLSSLPDKQQVYKNRSMLAEAVGISSNCLYFPSQVHKANIVQVTNSTTREMLQETDALVSDEQGLCITVMSADCVPILLYDTRNNAIGAVHAGWRGTVGQLLFKTLQTMKTLYGTSGKHIIAGIGPSVCQDSYQVGEEVIIQVEEVFGKNAGLLLYESGNKARLDLWKANALQLQEFGVPDKSIEISGMCTVKNNDSFFSARKGDTGRFCAGIMLVNG
jgi:polyphenol oxidase